MMDTQSVVENEIVHQFSIEGIHVLEQRRMEVDKFFLQGSVESLEMRVHFWRLGIGVEMHKVKTPQLFGEMFLELRTVVCEHKEKGVGKRKCLDAQIKEFFGCERRVA